MLSPTKGGSQLSFALQRRPSPNPAPIGRAQLTQTPHWPRCSWNHPLGQRLVYQAKLGKSMMEIIQKVFNNLLVDKGLFC